MLYEEANVFNLFIRPQRYTQCVLVNNIESKHNLFLLEKKTPQGSFNVAPRLILQQAYLLFDFHSKIKLHIINSATCSILKQCPFVL